MLYLFIDESIGMLKIEKWAVLLQVGLYLAVAIAFYLFRSFGVYRLAKNQNIKGAFMAFIPFVWIYPFIMLVKNERFFGVPYKKVAVLLAVIYSIGEFITVFYNAVTYYPLVVNYFNGVEIFLMGAPSGATEYFVDFLYVGAGFKEVYGNVLVLEKILNFIYYISGVFDLACSVIVIFAYFAVFKKYWPSHFVLASILSLWIFPIMVFVIRNKKPVNYFEFVRSKYGSYGTPFYGNPYGRPNETANNERREESPFEDFENRGRQKVEDPFEEFNTDDKDKR